MKKKIKQKIKQESIKKEVKLEENAAAIVKTDVAKMMDPINKMHQEMAKMMDFHKIYSDSINEMHQASLGSGKIRAALMEAA
jgi:hypothetical protein